MTPGSFTPVKVSTHFCILTARSSLSLYLRASGDQHCVDKLTSLRGGSPTQDEQKRQGPGPLMKLHPGVAWLRKEIDELTWSSWPMEIMTSISYHSLASMSILEIHTMWLNTKTLIVVVSPKIKIKQTNKNLFECFQCFYLKPQDTVGPCSHFNGARMWSCWLRLCPNTLLTIHGIGVLIVWQNLEPTVRWTSENP